MVLHHLNVSKALGAHDPEHRIRLTDTYFKIQPPAGKGGLGGDPYPRLAAFLTGNRPGDRGYPWEMLPF